MGRGRPPLGPRLVEGLVGPEDLKERARVILETVAGERTVAEACRRLGVEESQFHALRREALQALLEGLSPKPRGRPPTEPQGLSERVAQLEEENRRMRLELRLAQVRAEVALVMPHLLDRPPGDPGIKKKLPTPPPRPQSGRRGQGKAGRPQAERPRRGRG